AAAAEANAGSRSAGSTPDIAQHVEHYARAEVVQLDRQFPHARQILPHRALPLHGTDDEQEAAAAGAGQLGAGRTGVERSGDRGVNLVVRDPSRELPFGLPALAHRGTDSVHVAVAQSPSGKAGEVAQEVELGASRFDVRALLDQNRVRASGYAGVKQHDLLLERPAPGRGQPQFLRHHLIAWPESDVADPAKRGNVLVLFADGFPAALDLDRAGPLGELFGRDLPSLVRE